MSKMIPPIIAPEVKSQAERDIYKWLEKLEWKNSVVLHSLGIAQHEKKIFGEIDFVIISNEGILCVEVKGGQVYRNNGIWYFKDRYGKEDSRSEGPFEQAQGNMNSLRKHFQKCLENNDPLVRCQYACCVMTPNCTIKEDAVDIIPEILFDIEDDVDNLGTFFDKSMEYWKNQCISKHGFEGGTLSNDDIKRAVDILRGDFKFVPSLSVILNGTDEQLLAVTDEQYFIMQGFSDSERLLISGAAGTGKTLLAIEQCRRLSASGKKVLYLCYNRLIATYIAELRDKENGKYDVYHINKLMMEVCNFYSDEDRNNDFFENELPSKFLELFEKGLLNRKYDAVVIDEGQDLMNTCYYSCINSLIKGGFSCGTWAVYFDPSQNIFNDNIEFDTIWKKLKTASENNYALTRNCRNTRQIAVANKMISNIPQAKQLRAEGCEVEYVSYSSISDEARQLITIIRKLRAQGVPADDIVILSGTEKKSCVLNTEFPSDLGEIRINPRTNLFKKNTTDFFTIQSYKGLESKVVILIDVEDFKKPNSRILNYVAISRARTLLYVVYNESVEEQRQEMLLKGALMI